MKLEVKYNAKGVGKVLCPRTGKMTESYGVCHHCEWLSIATAESVRCRWTKEKESIKTGRSYWEI